VQEQMTDPTFPQISRKMDGENFIILVSP